MRLCGTLTLVTVAVCLCLCGAPARAVLVAHWTFDDGAADNTTTTATEAVAGNDGTLTNMDPPTDWITTGLPPVPSGTLAALEFDGADDYVVATGYQGVTGQSARTVSSWVKVPTDGYVNGEIISWGTKAAGQKFIVRIQDSDGTAGAIRFEVEGGYVVGKTPVNDGEWHHVAVMLPDGMDNVNDARLFVDGVYDGYSAVKPQSMDTVASEDVRIGVGHANHYFEGQLDDVRVYDSAETPAAILAESGNTFSGLAYSDAVQADTPVAYWRLDEGVTDTKAFNSAVGGTTDPWTKNGDYANGATPTAPSLLGSDPANPAVSLDGSNDQVNIPDNADLNANPTALAQRTVELWFNADDATSRQVLYEEGGATNGLGLWVENGEVHLQAWNTSTSNGPGDDWGGGGDLKDASIAIEAGKTYHAVLVMDGDDTKTGTLTGYLSGTEFAQVGGVGLFYSHTGDTAIGAKRNDTRFGTATSGGDGNRFDGVIDEVAVYNSALDADRVSLHNALGESYSSTVLADDPVAYWRLDERSGTAADNRATVGSGLGAAADGTHSGGVTQGQASLVPNSTNPAATFDAASAHHVDIPSVNGINLGGPFAERTIELWFNAADAAARQVLFEEGGQTNGINVYIDAGKLYVLGYNGGNNGTGSPWGGDGSKNVSTDIAAGETCHVSLVLDGNTGKTGTITGYLNGEAFGQIDGVGLSFPHTGNMAIGGIAGNTTSATKFHDGNAAAEGNYFTGTIDDVAVYNASLSTEQMQTHYIAAGGTLDYGAYGNAVLADNPTAYWQLGETSGNGAMNVATTVTSAAGLGDAVNSRYVGGATLGAASLVPGADNGAVVFDGSNSSVNIPDHDEINLGADKSRRSVELWFNPADTAARQVIFEAGGDTNGLNAYIEGGKVHVGVWSNDGNDMAAFASAPVEAGDTHQLSLVFDQPNDCLIGYLDGTPFGTQKGLRSLPEHTADIAIGAMRGDSRFDDGGSGVGESGDGRYFVGTIDDVALYNSGLAAGQVRGHLGAVGIAVGSPYEQGVLADDPMAYYRFTEVTGNGAANIASDGSGLGNAVTAEHRNGVAIAQPSLIAHPQGDGAIHFDGVDGVTHIPDHSKINTGTYTKKTVELWFKADQFSDSPQVLFEEGGTTRGLNLYIDGGELVYGIWSRGNNADANWEVFLSEAFDLEAIHHAVLVFDSNASNTGSGVVQAYLDGMLVGEMDGANRLFGHSDDMALGGILGTTLDATLAAMSAAYFQGTIDEFALYDYALSRDQIYAHYQEGVPEPATVSLLGLGLLAMARRRKRR